METNKKNNRITFLYILLSIVIIILAFTIVFCINKFFTKPVEETTTEPTTVFMNGLVPYYENIPANTYKSHEFSTDDDGRIVYDGTVGYSTGIDVSSHQGKINWDKVYNDGIEFVFIRAGLRGYGQSGMLHEDERFMTNYYAAKDAGLKVGAYFFSQATNTQEAVEEAEYFLKTAEGLSFDLPIMFDWENEPDVPMRTDNVPGDVITDCAVAFCEKIKEAGYEAGIYFNLNDAYYRYNLDKIKDYTFWFAQHNKPAPEFYYNYAIWQYSDSGSVDGINGRVDMNISFNVAA